MTNIVEQLREHAKYNERFIEGDMFKQAADEIEKLRTEMHDLNIRLGLEIGQKNEEIELLREEVKSEQRWASFYAQESLGRQAALESSQAMESKLRQRLHEVSLSWQEGQAREAKLREALDKALGCIDGYYRDEHYRTSLDSAFVTSEMAYDDTALKEALKQAKKEALLEAAEWFANMPCSLLARTWPAHYLRVMAEELK
jgi:Skp family chaperone for outer membrane proteins